VLRFLRNLQGNVGSVHTKVQHLDAGACQLRLLEVCHRQRCHGQEVGIRFSGSLLIPAQLTNEQRSIEPCASVESGTGKSSRRRKNNRRRALSWLVGKFLRVDYGPRRMLNSPWFSRCLALSVAAMVTIWGLGGCSVGGGSVAAFCSTARSEASALSGTNASAKAAALGRVRGISPGEIASSLKVLSDAFNAQNAAMSGPTASTLKTADAFKSLAPQSVTAGPDGERVDRFLIDRCGLRSPTL
jgi:hypothetical protein